VDLATDPVLLLTRGRCTTPEFLTDAHPVLADSWNGDCREVHHAARSSAHGAAAVNPYLAFETVDDLVRTGALTGIEPAKAIRTTQGAGQAP